MNQPFHDEESAAIAMACNETLVIAINALLVAWDDQDELTDAVERLRELVEE